ncbi:MAG: FkbM family methyltransferase [Planctomycetota bacterium]
MAFKALKAYLRRRQIASRGLGTECKIPKRGYGDGTGLWTICDSALPENAIVYSFGVGDDISWDVQMIERHGVELHAFDPTPRSIEWLESQTTPKGFSFHGYGISAEDGFIELFPPRKDHKIHFTAYKKGSSAETAVRCPCKCLKTIVSELGHERVDVLKIDIEGAEMSVLPDILSSGIPVSQLLIEFHYNYPDISLDDTQGLIELIRQHGYRNFHVSDRGYEFSFIHESALQFDS